ncbi:PREDICTED: aldehyde oxidase GLOX-like [Tarenaya hassleriana]|uniref:aldehyde oxidase GLOX-like n=1 Tax=Tarenaya hassleriana TaxID=28532 RepID=UPI0008FD669B|nr:PREDICTED: aldehyde oxidase GLOX-like [Tarenaya hassleriana]
MARPRKCLYLVFISYTLQQMLTCHVAYVAGDGRWELLRGNAGISAMHIQLLRNDRVVMFDRTNWGPSNISLPDGKCRNNPNDRVSKMDCTAHSVEYDVVANRVRPLTVMSNPFCSSGSVRPDGTLVQTGGDEDGDRMVRLFSACEMDGCDWTEIKSGLAVRRWYASDHILPDGRQVIVGGREQFNFEFFPKTKDPKVYSLPFLSETNDNGSENNLYPFIFLNVDGNLFVFANNRAILLDYGKNVVVKTYPMIPGGDPRSYPSSGSAVLIPLKNIEASNVEADVLVCGGAPKGAYQLAWRNNTFVEALNTCARIKITDPNPQWTLETMPHARVMGDMILLPNGNVLIINGCAKGTASYQAGQDPVFAPVLYRPDNPIGSRFETLNPNTTPRMYHSTAVLLRDGRVLVGGSNPNPFYNFTGVLFPTELSLQAFSPSYLDPGFSGTRPKIISPDSQSKIEYNSRLKLRFAANDVVNNATVRVTMVFPSFTTHSFSMNQRLLFLDIMDFTPLKTVGNGKSLIYEVVMKTPRTTNIAPPGYYMMFLVNGEIPSEGIWVQLPLI